MKSKIMKSKIMESKIKTRSDRRNHFRFGVQRELRYKTLEDGAVIDAAGSKSDVLYTLGPPLKGRLWESIAVSEIRVQIAELAATLTDSEPARPEILESSAEANLYEV